MLQACEDAKISIDLEQFIFITNEIGKRFIEVCARKAIEGVKIRFLWDAAGSFSFFGSSIVEELKEKGIELVFFKTLMPSIFELHRYRSWYFRNHKRTLVIDNKIGFTGSICVSDAMVNWRDTVVRLEGNVVEHMQAEFERTWNRAIHKKNKDISRISTDREFRYITNYPFPGKHFLYKEIIEKIKNAKKYIYITTPYFIPTRHLSRVIRRAARRGIDVKIIVPIWSNHPIVDLCSRSFYTKMLKAGVKIYLYKGQMVHNKTITVDDTWSTVGTLNLDTISLLYNFEANIISTNELFTNELNGHFINDLKDTEEITYTVWKDRFWVEKFFGFLARFFRDFL
jgi:cardiolipin synthase